MTTHPTSRRHGRRTVRGAVLAAAAVALAACGSAPSAESTKTPTPARIRVAAGASASGSLRAAAASSVSAAGDSAAVREPGVLPYRSVAYVLRGSLPELTGDAPAWHLPRTGTVGATRVAALAAGLGLAGPVVAVVAEQGGGWRVGPGDGSAPTLTVQADAAASWFYDGAGAMARMKVECSASDVTVASPPVADGAGSVSKPVAGPNTAVAPDQEPAMTPTTTNAIPAVCEPPAPPTNLPSAAAARAAAVALATRLGAPTTPAVVQVTGDDTYARWTSWAPTLGAASSPLTWSASFGDGGELVFASGSLATPVAAAPYPRIGTTKAFELLKTQNAAVRPQIEPASGAGSAEGGGSASAGSVGVAADAGAAPPAGGVPQTVTSTASSSPRSTSTTPAGRDATTTTGVWSGPGTTAPMVVTVTSVEAVLFPLYGVDGDVWFVPAYRFVTSDGDIVVPAIDASYIEQVTPDDGGLRADAPDTPAGAAGAGGPVAEPAPAVAKP